VQADRPEHCFGARRPILEFPLHRYPTRTQAGPQRGRRIGDHGRSRMLEQRQVGSRIADVVVTLIAKGPAQTIEFVAAREVGAAIAGQHTVEQANVFRNPRSQLLIRSGCQVKPAPFSSLHLQVFDQRTVVGQMPNIQRNSRAHLGFHRRLAAKKPHRQLKRGQRPVAQQQQQRIHESVALDQGAIQIDAQRPPGHLRCQLLER
jgi:hypothetical protein